MRRNQGILGLMGAIGVMGTMACGAAGRSSPPAQAPANEPAAGAAQKSATKDKASDAASTPASPHAEMSEEAAAPPPAAPAPVAEPSARSATIDGADPRGGYARARVQLSESRRRLDVAATQRDCANACRALDSMERAAGQLCELAQSSEERDTCQSAEDQLGSARQKVKSACGVCPKTK